MLEKSLLSVPIHLEDPDLQFTTWGPAYVSDTVCHIAAVTKPSTHGLQSITISYHGQMDKIATLSTTPSSSSTEINGNVKSLRGMRNSWIKSPEGDL